MCRRHSRACRERWRAMKCLGIESSCDETAAAVVEDGRRVLSDIVYTQIDVHRRFGGVVPELASRNHVLKVLPAIDEALEKAKVTLADIDLISVTQGPGLQGALLVGLQVAKTLSGARNIPVVGVHHLEGHILAIRLSDVFPEPPYLALVVSGGHTSLYEVAEAGRCLRVSTTRDDAAGEAYDKVAKMLGLPYPGGRPIDELGQKGNPRAIRFPRALKAPGELDFSFSGLKTAVWQHLEWKLNRVVPQGEQLFDLCASFQEAVADSLTQKMVQAAKARNLKQLVLCGGVAANSRLRALALSRAAESGLTLFVPPIRLCTDNGAMIAVAGAEAFRVGKRSDLSMNALPAWAL
jgi:N6-L-threonylcarbamoyladenine synthase